MKKRKVQQCSHCLDSIEIHHIKKHERTCYLNPRNIKLIVTYLEQGLHDVKCLNRASFYRWSQKNNIMSSVWITTRMKLDNWTQAAFQLLIYAYLKGHISFERVDLLFSSLTQGTMWVNPKQLRKLTQECVNIENNTGDVRDSPLHANYVNLLAAIVLRAKRDIWITEISEEVDTSEETIIEVMKDAVDFLLSFAPDVLKFSIANNQVSSETLKYVQSLGLDTFYSNDQSYTQDLPPQEDQT